MKEEAKQRNILRESEHLKAEIGYLATGFAKQSGFHSASIVFQLIALSHEIALMMSQGDQSAAINVLSEAVNGTRDKAMDLYQKLTNQIERKHQ